jgi:hypothetical protein
MNTELAEEHLLAIQEDCALAIESGELNIEEMALRYKIIAVINEMLDDEQDQD